jgi:hypothetical protein
MPFLDAAPQSQHERGDMTQPQRARNIDSIGDSSKRPEPVWPLPYSVVR